MKIICMNIFITVLKYTYLATAICWFAAGSIVIASFFIAEYYPIINIVIGLFFVGIACFFSLKTYYTVALAKSLLPEGGNITKRFFMLDFAFMLFNLIVALAAVSGTSSRFFLEKLPVFG